MTMPTTDHRDADNAEPERTSPMPGQVFQHLMETLHLLLEQAADTVTLLAQHDDWRLRLIHLAVDEARAWCVEIRGDSDDKGVSP